MRAATTHYRNEEQDAGNGGAVFDGSLQSPLWHAEAEEAPEQEKRTPGNDTPRTRKRTPDLSDEARTVLADLSENTPKRKRKRKSVKKSTPLLAENQPVISEILR